MRLLDNTLLPTVYLNPPLRTGEAKELRDAYDTSGASDELRLFDESRLACESLRPGDGIFFHPMLAHGSGWG